MDPYWNTMTALTRHDIVQLMLSSGAIGFILGMTIMACWYLLFSLKNQ